MKKKSPPDWLPWIITLGALLIRLIYLLEISAKNPYFNQEILVAEVHHQWAKDIIAGGTSVQAEPFIRPPLYPYIVAGIYLLFGPNTLFPRLFQLLISAGMTYFVFRAGEKVFGRKGGIIPAILWAFYAPEIFFAGELFETSLSTALFFITYLVWERAENRGKKKWFLGAGLILGATALMRPSLLLLLPLLLIYCIWKKGNRIIYFLIFAVGVFIVILPVTIRNYATGKEFVLIASYDGLNYYLGNNPQADGVSAVFPQWTETESDREWGLKHHADALNALSLRQASALQERGLSPAENSRYWWKQALNFAFTQPQNFILLNLKKLLLFLNGYEYGNTRDLYFSRHLSIISSILLWNAGIKFPLGLTLPLAGLGIFYLIKVKGAYSRSIWVFLLSASISAIAAFVCARFRMAAIPFIFILAGGGLIFALKALKERKLMLSLTVLLPLLIVANVDFFKMAKDVSFQEYYNLGKFYLSRGDLVRAHQAFSSSQRSKPDFVPTLTELGLISENAGDYAQAVKYYQSVVEKTPEDPVALYNLGSAEARLGDLEIALQYLRQAVEIKADFWPAWLNLGNTLIASKDFVSAEKCYLAVLDLDPQNPDALFNLGNLKIVQNDYPSAQNYFDLLKSYYPDYPLDETMNFLEQKIRR